MPWTLRRRQAEGPRDRPRQQRLAGARDVLQQDVAVGQERDRDQPERLVPADDGAADGIAQAIPQGPAVVGRDGRSLERAQWTAARRRRTAGRMPPAR